MMAEPIPTSPSAPIDEAYDKETQQLLKNSKRMGRITYSLAVLNRVFTFLIQIGAAATAASCLQQYYSTNSGHNWSDGTIVWPTILNLLAALIIVIWSGVLLIGYCIRGAVEKRLEKYSPLASIIQNTLSAFATAIMLGTAANPASLEGQTCSNNPPTAVDATSFCFKQNFFQTVMLVQTWLGTVMYGWGKIVEMNQKKLERHNSQKPPLLSPATVEGNDTEKRTTDIEE